MQLDSYRHSYESGNLPLLKTRQASTATKQSSQSPVYSLGSGISIQLKK